MQRQHGLTLLELMLTMSILAIAVTLVVPSAQSLFQQQRIIATVNTMSASLQLAKEHAVTQFSDVTLCPTIDYVTCQNDWSQAKMIFVDVNDNNERENDETIIHSLPEAPFGVDITSSNNTITFYMSGFSATPSTILLCDRSDENSLARALFISLQGRVSVSMDNNGDGIHETNSGTSLDCSD